MPGITDNPDLSLSSDPVRSSPAALPEQPQTPIVSQHSDTQHSDNPPPQSKSTTGCLPLPKLKFCFKQVR
jgi:hypothetical protein